MSLGPNIPHAISTPFQNRTQPVSFWDGVEMAQGLSPSRAGARRISCGTNSAWCRVRCEGACDFYIEGTGGDSGPHAGLRQAAGEFLGLRACPWGRIRANCRGRGEWGRRPPAALRRLLAGRDRCPSARSRRPLRPSTSAAKRIRRARNRRSTPRRGSVAFQPLAV